MYILHIIMEPLSGDKLKKLKNKVPDVSYKLYI